jgi:molecular chaperone Hsp33
VLDADILLNLPYENLLKYLYVQDVVRIFEALPVTFSCTCSRKKSAEAISLIWNEEAEEELKGKNSIVVTCDFCSKEYIFDRVDVAEIFNNGSALPPDTHIH